MKNFKKKCNRHNRGITIFEVVIAVALFAIIITPVMTTFVNSIRVNQRARKVMVATDVAQSIIEGYSGKTYQEVWSGMQTALTGFSFASGSDNASLAFSSINEGYYNNGHARRLFNVDEVLTADLAEFPFPDTLITGINYDSTNKFSLDSSVAGMDLNTVISSPAVRCLKKDITIEAPKMPYEDEGVDADHPYALADNTPMTSDKQMLFGYCKDFYHDGYGQPTQPIISYIVYTRIQKDNYFFDAVVTFVPNSHAVPSGGKKTDAFGTEFPDTVTTDTFYTYKIRVTVYEYQYQGKDDSGNPIGYNPTDSTWPSRFDGDYFEGTPVAIMESGIPYKR